jgi:chromosome segregation ATPase
MDTEELLSSSESTLTSAVQRHERLQAEKDALIESLRGKITGLEHNMATISSEATQMEKQGVDMGRKILSLEKKAAGTAAKRAAKNKLEAVVICVDISGSMSGHLAATRTSLSQIVTELGRRNPSAQVAVLTHGEGRIMSCERSSSSSAGAIIQQSFRPAAELVSGLLKDEDVRIHEDHAATIPKCEEVIRSFQPGTLTFVDESS